LSIKFCCVAKKHRVSGKLSYHSGAAFYFYATLDQLKVTGFNYAIANAIGEAEGCHLPLWVNFELEMWGGKRSVQNN
jgi:hypothetical protein